MVKKKQILFAFIALLSLVLVAVLLFKFTSLSSKENILKSRSEAVLTPIFAKDPYKIEISYEGERQIVAVIYSEKRQLSLKEQDQIQQLLRATMQHNVSRGDVLRLIPADLRGGFLFFEGNTPFIIEVLTLIILIIFALYFYTRPQKNLLAKKAEPSIPTLSDYILQEPQKAASLMRLWMAK